MQSVVIKVNSSIRPYVDAYLANSPLSVRIQNETAIWLEVPAEYVQVEWIRVDHSFNAPDLAIEVRYTARLEVNPDKAAKTTFANALVTMVKESEGLPEAIRQITAWVIPEWDAVFAVSRK